MARPVTDKLSAEEAILRQGSPDRDCTNCHYWLGFWTSRMQASTYSWPPNMKDFSFLSRLLLGDSNQVGRRGVGIEACPFINVHPK
jgi:hypothetical protein